MNERITDAIIKAAIVITVVLLMVGCGTENDKRSSVSSSHRPDSIIVEAPTQPAVVEVCNYTKLNKRRIRRFLCKKRKNKKACRRKVNKLLRKSKRFPKILGESND